ncbi:MAG: hypothetical protein PHE92_04570, partial [Candidatus Cloacimonetes bacterium]|nr:hypothetical protein [Candidatus Cloacimonadota bacterium]
MILIISTSIIAIRIEPDLVSESISQDTNVAIRFFRKNSSSRPLITVSFYKSSYLINTRGFTATFLPVCIRQ